MDDTSFVPVAANPCLDLDRSEIPRETNTSTPRLLFFSISFLPFFLPSRILFSSYYYVPSLPVVYSYEKSWKFFNVSFSKVG